MAGPATNQASTCSLRSTKLDKDLHAFSRGFAGTHMQGTPTVKVHMSHMSHLSKHRIALPHHHAPSKHRQGPDNDSNCARLKGAHSLLDVCQDSFQPFGIRTLLPPIGKAVEQGSQPPAIHAGQVHQGL